LRLAPTGRNRMFLWFLVTTGAVVALSRAPFASNHSDWVLLLGLFVPFVLTVMLSVLFGLRTTFANDTLSAVAPPVRSSKAMHGKVIAVDRHVDLAATRARTSQGTLLQVMTQCDFIIENAA